MSRPVYIKHSFRLAVMVASIVLTFTSCKVSWVPEYSAELETQIVRAAKENNALYIEMLDAAQEKRGYQYFAEKYQSIESEINSIELKISGQKNNKDFIVLIENIKETFVKFKKMHKEKKTLSDGIIQLNDKQMQALWKPLYIAERGIKMKDDKK